MVGDVDAQQTIQLADKYFAGLQPSVIQPVKPQDEIEQKGVKKITVKAPAKLPFLMLGYKTPLFLLMILLLL